MPEAEICNYEGLVVRLRSDNEELLKHPEVFHIFTFHPIYHYINEKGDYIGGEVIMADSCFKNCIKRNFSFNSVKFDIVLDYSNVIWKKLFHITTMGDMDYEEDKENKIYIFHFNSNITIEFPK